MPSVGGDPVYLQIGQESVFLAKNDTGVQIDNGTAVCVSGSLGDRPKIILADYLDSDLLDVAGITTENIPAGEVGYVTSKGLVRGIKTDYPTWASGDKLYLSLSGSMSNSHPSNPIAGVVILGTIIRTHANDGIILVHTPQKFTLGNNFNGTLRQSIINKSTGSNSGVGFTAVNNDNHRITIGMAGTNNTAFGGAEAAVYYNEGYGPSVFAVDGNENFEWYIDRTDSHNNSALSYPVMKLSPSGTLWLNDGIISGAILSNNTTIVDTDYQMTVTDSVVMASGDIMITLPDAALKNKEQIYIKNIGTYTDLVEVSGYNGQHLNGLTRYGMIKGSSVLLQSDGSNWKNLMPFQCYRTLTVSPAAPFTNISQVIDFYNAHMNGNSTIRVECGTYTVDDTITVDLPYNLFILGNGIENTVLCATSGLADKPMFNLLSPCNISRIGLSGNVDCGDHIYGVNPEENAVNILSDNLYHEIKDTNINGFYDGILISGGSELWSFDMIITDNNHANIEVNSVSAAIMRISEADLGGTPVGVMYTKAGAGSQTSIEMSHFDMETSGDVCFTYVSADCSFDKFVIGNNVWNQIGTFYTGLDFSLSAFADLEINNNTGKESKKPHAKINVVDNSTPVTVTDAGTFYKANFTSSSTYTCKFGADNNRLTYWPKYTTDVLMWLNFNVQVNQVNRNITVAIKKNNTTIISPMTVRTSASGQPYAAGMVAYLEDVEEDDYFEIFVTSSTNGDQVIVQDLTWYAEAR